MLRCKGRHGSEEGGLWKDWTGVEWQLDPDSGQWFSTTSGENTYSTVVSLRCSRCVQWASGLDTPTFPTRTGWAAIQAGAMVVAQSQGRA